jgi:acetyltransferase-like isoleucine patch superfamily enzyme
MSLKDVVEMQIARVFQKVKKSFGLFSILHGILQTMYLRLILRKHGVVYGKNLKGNQCKIQAWGRIELGDNVELLSYPDGETYKTCLITWHASSLIKIGNNCYLNGTVIHSRSSVTIGENCMFGAGTVILDSDFHSTSVDPEIRRGQEAARSRPVVIGNNVWVCRNAIILKGVHIGDNSIIGAGSIVTKDVPPSQVFGGNPAHFIREVNK